VWKKLLAKNRRGGKKESKKAPSHAGGENILFCKSDRMWIGGNGGLNEGLNLSGCVEEEGGVERFRNGRQGDWPERQKMRFYHDSKKKKKLGETQKRLPKGPGKGGSEGQAESRVVGTKEET